MQRLVAWVPGWRALGLGDGVGCLEAIPNIHNVPGGDIKSPALGVQMPPIRSPTLTHCVTSENSMMLGGPPSVELCELRET